ncbi:MAG: DUF3822 family protein [Bacteroidales bacterium]|nr:DUF3822 family protein [Bacteroidales bacterium]
MPYLINKRIDLTRTFKYRLSIQADLSGFSFAILDDAAATCLQLHHHPFPNTIDDLNDLYTEAVSWRQKYSQLKHFFSSAQCVYCAPYFTLIPESIFVPEKAATILQSIHTIHDLDEVYYHPLPQFEAVCIYSVPNSITAPILKSQSAIRFYSIAIPLIQMTIPLYGHARALFFYQDQYLYLTLMKEKQLLLCNAYHAPEFTTALFFLFFVLHQWQLNPETIRLYIGGQISRENRQLLHNYFPLISILHENSVKLSSLENNLLYSTILHPVCASSEAL